MSDVNSKNNDIINFIIFGVSRTVWGSKFDSFYNIGKSRQIRFHRKDVEENLTYFTNVVKTVKFASPYCNKIIQFIDLM